MVLFYFPGLRLSGVVSVLAEAIAKFVCVDLNGVCFFWFSHEIVVVSMKLRSGFGSFTVSRFACEVYGSIV